MPGFLDECNDIISQVEELLNQKKELWELNFKEYAESILTNLDIIKKHKKRFHEWAPLYLYMNITQAKNKSVSTSGKITFNLRYHGQNVAELKLKNDRITIFKMEKIDRDFGCIIPLEDHDWTSEDAGKFRTFFKNNPKRENTSGKKNEEHKIESLLLSEFSKKSSNDKALCNIQPVKLASVARFQMATPLSASNVKKLKYSGTQGGGIDILARVGSGKSTKLCVMEIKDENVQSEPPVKVIQQGLAYAAFIRRLLRSSSGAAWWKIFGFNGKVPQSLNLYVACVMPSNGNNDTSFRNVTVPHGGDSFHFHYLYFEEKSIIQNIKTSL